VCPRRVKSVLAVLSAAVKSVSSVLSAAVKSVLAVLSVAREIRVVRVVRGG
jgi:hypothetical protein